MHSKPLFFTRKVKRSMKQQFFQPQQQASPRRKAAGQAGSHAVGLPPLLRACLVTGTEPVLSETALTLAGTVIQYVWFNTSSDRAHQLSPILGAELRIESCEKYRVPALVRSLLPPSTVGSQMNRTLAERAVRYQCRAVLVEDVRPDSLYGRWVRLQGGTEPKKLDAEMRDGKITTPFDFHLLVGEPSGKEVLALKIANGVEAVQGQLQIVAPEFRGNLDRYTDMQIDRVFEAFRVLSVRTRLGLYPPTGTRVVRESALAAVEQQEQGMLPELAAVYDRLVSLRREYDVLVAANAAEEERLRGLVTVREGLTVEAAEAELQAKRIEFGLQAAIDDEAAKDQALKALKKKVKNQQDYGLSVAREAAKAAETKRKEIERRLKPFEEKVRSARKVDRGPQDRLEAFLRTRKQTEEAAGLAFNGLCTSSRPLWRRADDAFFRREELLCLLRQS